MTTEAFLATLRRFHGRRGIGSHIYSVNGSNFVGAARELQSTLQMMSTDPAINKYCTNTNIEWHFIPPGAPNFGGLWEAAIKSTKYYLKRVSLDLKESHLSRWQHIQRMVQHFWQRWHKEYLLTMQQRHKWKKISASPSVGDLVVIIDQDVPPTKWLMGRITKLVPGGDGLVRVVGIKTKNGDILRPISKICILPSDSLESMGAKCPGSTET